jgi:ubiquinone/menaquinone biosynthesis C-methylase UbiE
LKKGVFKKMEIFPTDVCWKESGAAGLYDCLAKDPGYRDANRHLVSLLKDEGLCSGQIAVNAGSGTGVDSELLLDEILGTEGHVIGIDCSGEMVCHAQKAVSPTLPIDFRIGDAHRISDLVEEDPVHAIVSFNLVHLLEDLLGAMRDWYEKLPDGGMIGFNSTVYDGAIPREARSAYWKAIMRVHRLAKQRFPETIGTRKQMLKHTAEYYFTVVQQAGFTDIRMEEKVFSLSKEGVLALLQVPGIADSMMPADIPLSDQRNILIQSIKETVTKSLPRKYVFITAHKKEVREKRSAEGQANNESYMPFSDDRRVAMCNY